MVEPEICDRKMAAVHERINDTNMRVAEMKPVLDRVEVNQANTNETLGKINETLVRMDERARAKKRFTKTLFGIAASAAGAIGALLSKVFGG